MDFYTATRWDAITLSLDYISICYVSGEEPRKMESEESVVFLSLMI